MVETCHFSLRCFGGPYSHRNITPSYHHTTMASCHPNIRPSYDHTIIRIRMRMRVRKRMLALLRRLHTYTTKRRRCSYKIVHHHAFALLILKGALCWEKCLQVIDLGPSGFQMVNGVGHWPHVNCRWIERGEPYQFSSVQFSCSKSYMGDRVIILCYLPLLLLLRISIPLLPRRFHSSY